MEVILNHGRALNIPRYALQLIPKKDDENPMTTQFEVREKKKFGDVNRNIVNGGDVNRRIAICGGYFEPQKSIYF